MIYRIILLLFLALTAWGQSTNVGGDRVIEGDLTIQGTCTGCEADDLSDNSISDLGTANYSQLTARVDGTDSTEVTLAETTGNFTLPAIGGRVRLDTFGDASEQTAGTPGCTAGMAYRLVAENDGRTVIIPGTSLANTGLDYTLDQDGDFLDVECPSTNSLSFVGFHDESDVVQGSAFLVPSGISNITLLTDDTPPSAPTGTDEATYYIDRNTGHWCYVLEADGSTHCLSNKNIKDIVIPDPATADAGDGQIKFPYAVVITRISCSTAGASSTATIQFDERAEGTPNVGGTDVMSSTLVCDTDSQVTTTFANAGIAANAPMNLDIDAVANAPTVVRIHVEYAW